MNFNKMKILTIVTCLVALPTTIMLSLIYQNNIEGSATDKGGKVQDVSHFFIGSEQDSSDSDELLGGLLASGFDEESCLSRYQSVLYRKTSPHKPSPYLLSKLRNYETLHRRCGPYTKSYNRTLKVLNSRNIQNYEECNYVVWTGLRGLGNRILSMASAFLYALLTNKILLVQHEKDMSDLFCEPFLNTSWLLPQDFPLKNQFQRFNYTYGSKLRDNMHMINGSVPSFLNLNLSSASDDYDKLFYCDEHQLFLEKVPWLILKSDLYFIPSLFLIPNFEQELGKMFPDKESVFHHLGRYLFSPSNKSWGLITRFYQAYLSKADERIGMQIRIFNPEAVPFPVVTDQILACTQKQNVLPEVDKHKLVTFSPRKNQTSSKAILIASLHSEFYETIRKLYWKYPTTKGEVIGVYQPTFEKHQHFGENLHNLKAWAEINLLSMSDVLVTSTWSTFGYVAQGLRGLKPWILFRPASWKNPYPTCQQAMSTEPCLHRPPTFECKAKLNADMGSVLPYVQHCEKPVVSGIKLVNNYNI
ncbi:galactoside 2-alpha-L-fucosyltransferase-like [Mercurialis annua]|uniref:galactoside 2-alpha-L-fucosyltransferase-like n=1 Tax=Mercurialis annua TaxID=3986 RepID=UPI00215FB926|nr:galactoside 2-alpha-L-fucosyltransferase-like [Mercurialis annua]